MCVCGGERERECVRVCKRERKKERESERERVREREREKEHLVFSAEVVDGALPERGQRD